MAAPPTPHAYNPQVGLHAARKVVEAARPYTALTPPVDCPEGSNPPELGPRALGGSQLPAAPRAAMARDRWPARAERCALPLLTVAGSAAPV
jgi:hypothetical protein